MKFFKNTNFMYNRFHIILAFFIFFILYLLYQIILFKVDQFRTDNFTQTIIAKNNELNNRIESKEATEQYIYTNAYRTQIAKATQNKNMPGETIVNIISQEEMNGNKDIDAQAVYAEASKQIQNDPTLKMSNPEKWQYLIQNGIRGF